MRKTILYKLKKNLKEEIIMETRKYLKVNTNENILNVLV